MSSADEDRFLKKQKEERKAELPKVGEMHEMGPKVVEGEGKGTRKPSELANLVDLRTEPAREAAKAGRRRTRRHKRKHSRRRR
jgi:hypothetical protein